MAVVSIIEDDPSIRTALVRALTQRGHAVTTSPNGLAGLQHVIDDRPDLVVLDLGLPDVDGLNILTMLRAVTATPVVVVTARDDDTVVVRCLDAGADDYVVKPFSADQLEARIRAVLRRAATGSEETPIVVGDLVVDPAARTVMRRGDVVDLSRREFDLLLLLARRVGEVVSKRDILAEVWRQAWGGSERTVDVHLSWLRRKLGETAAEPVYLHSVRGVGVRLVDPTDRR